MKIREVKLNDINDELAEMVALFRVELRSYKGIISTPKIEAGKEEMEEYLLAKFPVFVALVDGNYAGYMVCCIFRMNKAGMKLASYRPFFLTMPLVRSLVPLLFLS